MDNFWIEAGELSGGSRNQIEFDEELANFFSPNLPPVGGKIQIALDIGNRNWVDCDLVHKVTSYGVDIFRMNMVTGAKGGEDYAGRVVHFSKAGGRYFKVQVADMGSSDHRTWMSAANRSGVARQTGGAQGRNYGMY